MTKVGPPVFPPELRARERRTALSKPLSPTEVFRSASVVLPLDVVCAVGLDEPPAGVVDLLARQLANQLDQMACCIARFSRVSPTLRPRGRAGLGSNRNLSVSLVVNQLVT